MSTPRPVGTFSFSIQPFSHKTSEFSGGEAAENGLICTGNLSYI
jgi:hypothetical protein